METKMKVKGLVSKNTIVLHPTEGQPINISRETNEILFLEVQELLKSGSADEIVEKYLDIKSKVERYSLNLFTVDEAKGEMYLKGSDVPVPQLIIDKLFELEEAGEDFMPLIRFWKKLQRNPSEASRQQLYGFMVHNGIGLSELGDIIVEKGVGAKNGILVDKRTSTIDNSIGETVVMDRDKVDADPNVTCSYGLHVGAPQYVRRYYSGIIVKCAVNPEDVVAVPTDYNNTKMRVCRYTVLGFSDENSDHKPVYKLSDFVNTPSEDVQGRINASLPTPVVSEVDEDEEDEFWDDADWDYDGEEDEVDEIEVSEPEVVKPEPVAPDAEYIDLAKELLEGMTGKQILAFVKEETGVLMPYSDKSKATLVKRGSEILAKHLETLDNK